EVVKATCAGKFKRRTATAQCRIHSIGLKHRCANQRCVPMDMIDSSKECEVALALNDPEDEAPPLQGIRYGHDVSVYFVNRHCAVISRREFNFSRIADGMP